RTGNNRRSEDKPRRPLMVTRSGRSVGHAVACHLAGVAHRMLLSCGSAVRSNTPLLGTRLGTKLMLQLQVQPSPRQAIPSISFVGQDGLRANYDDCIQGGFSDSIFSRQPKLRVEDRADASVDAIHMPRETATMPRTRLKPIGSLRRIAARMDAVTGFTVRVLATRVGVVRSKADTQRKKDTALPISPK